LGGTKRNNIAAVESAGNPSRTVYTINYLMHNRSSGTIQTLQSGPGRIPRGQFQGSTRSRNVRTRVELPRRFEDRPFSSRKMEQFVETNITARALAADTTPHFTVIADFISSMNNEISDIFVNVLMVCNDTCLVGSPTTFPRSRIRPYVSA
jgi:hypothetical protein